ncbi:Holliday junction resolvase RuvX [Tumebacillus permanentifrigoris]|jgi:putative Holliday junction resolvase|uniref:Putative pre-16S rRNA nuclease n=1 Tax=Tumebacillus permanentifrigoris TaxID=378543 RepID=A0A316D2K6_9BACL|nr:Holliday junction resolvase RuvX [Tumebacillus permanentifrigoris]PWK05100.1 putative Holliday junction resolvase [Tumebacillus permanentifrigoris]
MNETRVLGIDYGDVRMGIAVSDLMGWTAQGVETIHRKSLAQDLARIGELIREYAVDRIVLGFPKNMNNTIGPRGELSQQFAETLKEQFGLPVTLWDERLSTMAAERMLVSADVSRKKRKQVIDKMAAAIILQNYLDAQKN